MENFQKGHRTKHDQKKPQISQPTSDKESFRRVVVLLLVFHVKKQMFSNRGTGFDSSSTVAMSLFRLLAIKMLLNIGRILHDAEKK